MNELQEKIFDVIMSLLSGKSFASSVRNSAIRYGFLNYVAKFSLANDYYYASPSAFDHLYDSGFLRSERLRRSMKSKRNMFTYEHVIPVNVIGNELLKYPRDPNKVREILIFADYIVILTPPENALLAGGSLRSKMPCNFEFFTSDPFSRYIKVGLPELRNLIKVPVFGALRR